MKIYTRTGDKGSTSLANGQRRPKNDPRIEAYGTIDELNSWLGLLLTMPQLDSDLHPTLLNIQSRLYDIGAQLAGAPNINITPKDINQIEQTIDQLTTGLPPLTQFILPGGTKTAAMANIARTVCRRAERLIVALTDIPPHTLQYINRLSDLLFTIGRHQNLREHKNEIFWQKNC